MMHNTLFVYALLNEKEIKLWEKNEFKCVGISTPHICKEQQYRYLQEGNLVDKVHLFDFSFNLFEVEEPEQQSITLRRLKILLANMGISLNLLSLEQKRYFKIQRYC